MITPIYSLFLIIGLIFGFIAAVMAFLITYNEYLHHYKSKKEPFKISIEMALITFIIFIFLSLIAGFWLYKTL